METIFNKVSVIQNELSHGRLSISFPNTFLWFLPNIEQKRIRLNDNKAWWRNSRVIIDMSSSDSFFLFSVPKYLGSKLFYSFLAQTSCIFEKCSPQKKKKKRNLKGLCVKINPLRIWLVYKFHS